MYEPKKTIFANIQLTDTAGLDPKAGAKERNRVFGIVQTVDSLLWVIGNFEGVASRPESQLEDVKSEILLRDLELVETRIDRLVNAKRKLEKNEEEELEFLKDIKETYDLGNLPDPKKIENEKKKLVSSLSLFALKPSLVLLNSDEKNFGQEKSNFALLSKKADESGLGFLEICGKYEMELNSLEEEEKKEFLKELGLEESGIERLSKELYNFAGLLSFFTVGKDEVRAWTVEKGSNAKEAAGKIHSDLERGFIRAEIMKYDDIIIYGSEKELKEKGLLKVVGKEHIVEDGDIINVRFNV